MKLNYFKRHKFVSFFHVYIHIFVLTLSIRSPYAISISPSFNRMNKPNALNYNNNNNQNNINNLHNNLFDYASFYDAEVPDEQKLIAECLAMYDPASRPVFNSSKAVSIHFGLSLIQIYDMVFISLEF